MIWLGSKRGYLTDWITQCWVKLTGKRIKLEEYPWLEGPVAPTKGISPDFFKKLADEKGLTIKHPDPVSGIVSDFSILSGATFNPADVHPSVIQFYQETSAYELDA
jgi:hypothetical protein